MIALLFAHQINWICFQSNPALWLPCFQKKLLLMFLVWCSVLHSSTPLHDWVLKNKHLSISQFPSCCSFYLLHQKILKYQKSFKKILQPSIFNVCFRGVLASVHGQQLHSLEAFLKLLLVIHLHILSKSILDKTWDCIPCIVFQSLKKCYINSTLLNNRCMKYKWNIL